MRETRQVIGATVACRVRDGVREICARIVRREIQPANVYGERFTAYFAREAQRPFTETSGEAA